MNNELDREALLIYLNDLRTMETIVHEDNKKLKSLEEKTRTYEKKYNAIDSEMRTQVRNKPSPPMKMTEVIDSDKHDEKLRAFGIWIAIEVVIVAIFGMAIGFEYIGAIIVTAITVGIIALVFCVKNYNERIESIIDSKNLRVDQQKKRIDRYEENCSIKKKEVSAALTKLNTFKRNTEECISDIKTEKEELEEKLQEAYSANIIPLQFRNIEGIYYLYDYISTSNQGLSEALMQCNLEAIKQQINQVVNLQGEMIVRQAQHNAAMYEQNQQILNMARATVVNTAMAAKYAKISSINSDVALRLQSKDLAYQKADFWLK